VLGRVVVEAPPRVPAGAFLPLTGCRARHPAGIGSGRLPLRGDVPAGRRTAGRAALLGEAFAAQRSLQPERVAAVAAGGDVVLRLPLGDELLVR
jgi:hypothetical protein